MLDIKITLDEMKNYLRMNGFNDFPNEEDNLISNMIDGAIEDVSNYVNRDYENIPARFKISIMKIVAIKYENRTEPTKSLVDGELKELWRYRRCPGL